MFELKQLNGVCQTSAEYDELTKAIREQGGHIMHTFSLGKDKGISVQYQIPVNKREIT